MSDTYYTQASPNWTISVADVTTDQYNINDRNYDTRYEVTGADGGTMRVYIDRLTTPFSGSYTDIDSIAITMHSGSYTNWDAASFVVLQNAAPSMEGRVGAVSGSCGTYLDANEGVFLMDIAPAYDTLRYVQLEVVGMPADPDITQVMLLRKRTLAHTSSLDKSYQGSRWYTKTSGLAGPHTLRHSNFRKPIQAFRKHYPLYGTADIAKGRYIHEDCRGALEPFIYAEGLTSLTYICTMVKDEPKSKVLEHDHKEIAYEFDEIYRIQSGYTT